MNPITMQLAIGKYIRLALEEGISSEDVPTNSVMSEYKKGEIQLVCREDDIIAELQIFECISIPLDPEARIVLDVRDREEIKKGQHLATVTGDMRVLLSGERAALDYLQQLSSAAIYMHTVAGMLKGTGTRLLDTRRIIPYMRILEKCAMRAGGGQNHHYNLSNGVPLKDNHIDAAGDVREVVTAAKAHAPFICRIEVEAENLDMVKEAVDTGAGIIMLDDVAPGQMTEAICYTDGRVETECPGNMARENTQTITKLGVDCASSGVLTHSFPILGVNLKHLKALVD